MFMNRRTNKDLFSDSIESQSIICLFKINIVFLQA